MTETGATTGLSACHFRAGTDEEIEMFQLLVEQEIPDSYAVKWEFDGEDHRISYGMSVRVFTSDINASHEFGECIRHALECAGKLERY